MWKLKKLALNNYLPKEEILKVLQHFLSSPIFQQPIGRPTNQASPLAFCL
jgi:hypothetical protein